MGDESADDQGPKKWSKAADEKLRKMWLKDAREKCDDKVRAFVECSKEHGLMVFIKCREHNRAMNDCVKNFTTEECWQQYREQKIGEFVAQGKVTIDRESANVGKPY